MLIDDLFSQLPLKGKKILLVEDQFINANLIADIFEDTGAEIINAGSANEAIAKVNQIDNIDVVLMDIQLPDFDGIEASRRIKVLRPKLPIIIQTAFALEDYVTKSKEAGCEYFITKPLNTVKLYEILKTILAKNS